MSKPITRISLALLISLALIAAIYVTVLGASEKAPGTSSAQAHMVNGLSTNLDHYRSSASALQSLQSDVQSVNTLQKDGPCHSEAQVSPED